MTTENARLDQHEVRRQVAPAATGGILGGPADVAQLVERHLAKVKVAGSIPVIRSTKALAFCWGLRHFSMLGAVRLRLAGPVGLEE